MRSDSKNIGFVRGIHGVLETTTIKHNQTTCINKVSEIRASHDPRDHTHKLKPNPTQKRYGSTTRRTIISMLMHEHTHERRVAGAADSAACSIELDREIERGVLCDAFLAPPRRDRARARTIIDHEDMWSEGAPSMSGSPGTLGTGTCFALPPP